jgi:hypothetical protein
MDQALYTRCNLYKSAVVSHDHNLAFNLVADFHGLAE